MFLSKLTLKNFRCFSSQQLSFSPGLNIITGPNGAGKSSVLEGVYYTCYAKSWRSGAARDSLIKLGQTWAHINLECNNETIKVGWSKEEKVVKIGEQEVKFQKEILSKITCILLNQGNISIIEGYPEERRNFLKEILFQADEQAIKEYSRLRAILKQRKAALEIAASQGSTDSTELKIWSEKLFLTNQTINEIEKKIITKLEAFTNELIKKAPSLDWLKKISLQHKCQDTKTQTFEQFWTLHEESDLKKELVLNQNLFGPQLNDFVISIEMGEAKIFASRGQQKLITFLLKAAATEIIFSQQKDNSIIFLIDDFFSEMDQACKKVSLEVLNLIKCQKILATPGEGVGLSIKNF